MCSVDKLMPIDKFETSKKCSYEVVVPGLELWEEIGEQICEIELSAFGPEKAFSKDELKECFESPDSIIVLARDEKTGELVGFSYAQPTAVVYPDFFSDRTAGEDTAYIYDTAFKKTHQGSKLVSGLSKELERQLVAKGFAFIEEDCANDRTDKKPGEETYADKIRKNYRSRIVAEEEHDSEFGPQVFFRIRLTESKKK